MRFRGVVTGVMMMKDVLRKSCVDKEIELYKLQRNYNELKEMLTDMKYLLVKIETYTLASTLASEDIQVQTLLYPFSVYLPS